MRVRWRWLVALPETDPLLASANGGECGIKIIILQLHGVRCARSKPDLAKSVRSMLPSREPNFDLEKWNL